MTKPEKIGKDLEKLVKGRAKFDIFNRIAFSTDASIYQIIPQCVVCPVDTADVAAVVNYARDNGIPVVGRGAGSGVAGESLTDGIVIDLTANMNRILSISDDFSTVVVQPGLVLDDLNNYLAQFGRKIGPDPSSGNRAVIGGVVANNATGAHSLQYGYISNYVECIEAVLADGSVVQVKNGVDPETYEDRRVGELACRCLELLDSKKELIAGAQPKTKRNRSGYNIVGVCCEGRVDMARLLAGSEGTLAVFTEITLRTVEVPQNKALLQVEFAGVEEMARAVPIIVEAGAATCELMDRKLVEMAAEAFPAYREVLPTHCAAALLVEHNGASEQEVRDRIEETVSAVGGLASGFKRIFDAEQQKKLWKSRKDAVPLLNRQEGAKHPIPFIEDISVENRMLAEYLERLEEIGKRYDISYAYYGHAGDGLVHVRPFLNLSNPQDVEKMKAIAGEAFALAWSLGGTISGEHADGLVRTLFLRKQYGEDYYKLLCGIKAIFDPGGVINPGKLITDDTEIMTRNMRTQNAMIAERIEPNLLFGSEEFRHELEQCDGCGVCMNTQAGLRMCPVYRATRDQMASSRAKVNLLSAWARGILKDSDFESKEFREILDLCINCKMCSVECPSAVDVSKLVTEARTRLARSKGMTLGHKALSHNRHMSRAGAMFAPAANFFLRGGLFKRLMEKAMGIDRRRTMPAFEKGSFVKKARRYLRRQGQLANPVDRVVYFVDSYANFNDHELGFAVVEVLRHNNIDVVVPAQIPAPITATAYGDAKTSGKDMRRVIRQLSRYVERGYKVVCSEPSAALCLRDEMRLYDDSEEGRRVAGQVYELMSYLKILYDEGRLTGKAADRLEGRRYAYHCPCHLSAMGASGASIGLISKLTAAEIADVNAGCCGLAGTYGMKKDKYDLSVEMGKEMAEAMNASGADIAVTECSACKMQIEHLTGKKVVHPVKVLAEAFGIAGGERVADSG